MLSQSSQSYLSTPPRGCLPQRRRRHGVTAKALILVFSLGLSLSSRVSPAAPDQPTTDAALPYPPVLSLPWDLLGIEPPVSGPLRSALTASADALAKSLISGPQSLSAYVGSRHVITRNNHLRSDQIQVGAAAGFVPPPGVTSLAIAPSWCTVFDRYVIFVTVADAERNTLLGSAHTSVARQDWDKPEAALSFLTAQLPSLARTALAAAGRQGDATDALHIGLALSSNHSRSDEGSSFCLNQILEEQLAPNFIVARELGGEPLALARLLLKQSPQLKRPSRTALLRWEEPSADKLPLTVKLTGTLAETVFGHHLQGAIQDTWTLRVGSGGKIATTGASGLTKLLTAEKDALRLDDWPQAAHIDRAWVYLDRGRAWGLKMNDRLIADVGGRTVKGHVVRFFGPEAGLTSPRGYPVEEGAIVYIRLGQRFTRKGMTFRKDPRTFPTPLPTAKTP